MGSQLEKILAINLLENSLLNQMNMALVENVNVLETCMEAVTSKFNLKVILAISTLGRDFRFRHFMRGWQ